MSQHDLRRHCRGGILALCLALLFRCFVPPVLHAQVDAESAPLSVVPGHAASLTGSVADTAGALIPGALLHLRNLTADLHHTGHSTETGGFRFANLTPGTYVLTVSAAGFDHYTSEPFQLSEGELRTGFEVALTIPVNRADVTVTLSTHDLAAEELHTAEQQRVLGVFPNFYTSFDANPAPLAAGQKFSLALRATLDPVAFATAGIVASAEQLHNTFPAYGRGTTGYAKRYGAAFTDGFTGKILGAAVFPSVFRQDPRYFYLGTGTVKHRAWHAVRSAFLARDDRSGHWEPNYSHILGNAAAGALSTTYHPAADSAGTLALNNALLGTVGEAGVNLTREFLLKHFTRNIPPPATFGH